MKRRNCLGLGTAALALAATFGLAAPLLLAICIVSPKAHM